MSDQPVNDEEQWRRYLDEAAKLAAASDAPHGPNPRVGCVVLDRNGQVVGRGYHRGAGTAHAEVMALQEAGERASGGTAIVTLEPCAHVGRTGPCTKALLLAGVRRVLYGQAEPSNRGGAAELRSGGVDVIGPFPDGDWQQLNTEWTHFQCTGRPFVTLKMAMSLDGRVGLPGNRPLRITGEAARVWTHRLRAQVGAVLIGSGTAVADDPLLTVRDAFGQAMAKQPLRVVIGERPLPENLALMQQPGNWVHLQDRDLSAALAWLAARDVWHVLVEGGPTLATALLADGLVDRLAWFVAPQVVGAGPVTLPEQLPVTHLQVSEVQQIGEDVLVIAKPLHPGERPALLGSQ